MTSTPSVFAAKQKARLVAGRLGVVP